jgi:hypothetical protein
MTYTIAVMAVWQKEMALLFENEYNMQEYGIQVLGWKSVEACRDVGSSQTSENGGRHL